MTWRIARAWLLITVAGIAMYLALISAGVIAVPTIERSLLSSDFWPVARGVGTVARGVGTVALWALAVAILLALDERSKDEEKIANMTFAGLAYVLLVKRKALLAIFVLSVVSVGLAGYYVSKWMGITLEPEGGTLSLKLPGQTVYYFPISSQQGWQNTGIKLKAGQPFKYSISGYVSPGFLQDIDERIKQLKLHKMTGQPYTQKGSIWQFTGPEGYPPFPGWYELKAKEDRETCDKFPEKYKFKKDCYNAVTKSFEEDPDLTVQGVAHNHVVGIILAVGMPKERGYKVRPDDQGKLILFDGTEPTHLKTTEANADGVLWVVINDASSYRWDNAGQFFLKLVTL